MKALSLIQPWATLVMLGYDYKHHETRSWQTKHRGKLGIHASAGKPKWAREAAETPLIKAALEAHGLTFDTLPRGAMLGTVEVVAMRPIVPVGHPVESRFAHVFIDPSSQSEMEVAAGDWSPGRWAWQLENRQSFGLPVQCPGALSIWEVPKEVEHEFIYN